MKSLPPCLQNVVREYLMPSKTEVLINKLQVLREIENIQVLVLDGENTPVKDLIDYLFLTSYRPVLTRC